MSIEIINHEKYYLSSCNGISANLYLGFGRSGRDSGKLNWKFETQGRVVTSPAVGPDGTIYVSSNDGYLNAVKPNRDLEWKYEIGSKTSSPAIDRNGTVYVSSSDNYLYSIGPTGI